MSLFQNILVVVDTSAENHSEVERAVKIAVQGRGRVHLLEVVKDANWAMQLVSPHYVGLHQKSIEEKRVRLNQIALQHAAPGVVITFEVLEGRGSEVTRECAHRIKADLIIRQSKGAHSHTTDHLGASAQRLIRQLPCAAWLISKPKEPLQRIVAAVDATPHDSAHAALNAQILSVACEIARSEGAQLHIVHAWVLYGNSMLKNHMPDHEYALLVEHNRRQHAENFEQVMRDCHVLECAQSELLEGDPSTVIPTYCREIQADLLVCGTIARYGIAGLLIGNTAERIMHRTDCSILALPPTQPIP